MNDDSKNTGITELQSELKKELNSPINISVLVGASIGLGLLIYFFSNSIVLGASLGLLLPSVGKYFYDNDFFIKTIKNILEQNQKEVLAYVEANQKENMERLERSLNKYDELPYKKYQIDLLCAMCGGQNNTLIDFETKNFVCTHCKNENAVFIQLATARKTQLQPDENLLKETELD